MGIKWWPYGYEDTNTFDDYLRIQRSDDYETRFRPDLKILWNGKYYLVDLKASSKFLPALALLLNAEREFPVFYVLDKKYMVFARDIVENQSKYLKCMLIFTQKNEEQKRLLPCINGFHVEHITTDAKIGECWNKCRGWFYRSGDTCVKTKYDAPLELLNRVFR